jgi:hypothetical protein
MLLFSLLLPCAVDGGGDDRCDTSLLRGVGLAGNNIAYSKSSTSEYCAVLCCAHAGCNAWTWANKSLLVVGGNKTGMCFLKSAAIIEHCGSGEACVSWSREAPPPSPQPPTPCKPTVGDCDRGWMKDDDGCCTRLALPGASSPSGVIAYPHGANLSTTVWEDRQYPWGGDAVLDVNAAKIHGFFAEFSNHCPMTYGTWYSSTHIRHAVAPADTRTGIPTGPFVPKEVAIPRAAGNPALLKWAGVRALFHGRSFVAIVAVLKVCSSNTLAVTPHRAPGRCACDIVI